MAFRPSKRGKLFIGLNGRPVACQRIDWQDGSSISFQWIRRKCVSGRSLHRDRPAEHLLSMDQAQKCIQYFIEPLRLPWPRGRRIICRLGGYSDRKVWALARKNQKYTYKYLLIQSCRQRYLKELSLVSFFWPPKYVKYLYYILVCRGT